MISSRWDVSVFAEDILNLVENRRVALGVVPTTQTKKPKQEPRMKVETKNRKKAMAGFRQMSSEQQQRQQVHEIIQNGAQ
ncbi:MAG: hypothetical protein FJ403_10485, partial [Verrucomicrobia bacterium]|nr:hypothetical protein [Verrucomicrobiota bacterium]